MSRGGIAVCFVRTGKSKLRHWIENTEDVKRRVEEVKLRKKKPGQRKERERNAGNDVGLISIMPHSTVPGADVSTYMVMAQSLLPMLYSILQHDWIHAILADYSLPGSTRSCSCLNHPLDPQIRSGKVKPGLGVVGCLHGMLQMGYSGLYLQTWV